LARLAYFIGEETLNKARSAVKNFFNQAFAVTDLANTAWNGIGSLVFQSVRIILSQFQALIIGVLDIVDGLVTGTFRACFPKREE
jgi:hypothetical protein